jgi:hypothetical protein
MKTLCLCGSVRFKVYFDLANEVLYADGISGITLGVWGNGLIGYIGDGDKLKPTLESIHFDKILKSNGIYVLDIKGYIGRSTNNEINFAKKNGKEVYYWSKNDLDLVWKVMHLIQQSTLVPVGIYASFSVAEAEKNNEGTSLS